MKKLLLFGILVLALNSTSQITLVPDLNFEQALINLGHDTGSPDGSVLTANINSITSLNVSFSNIYDLTGIQDFISLTEFNCVSNQLTSLDISQNTDLTDLACYYNQITSLSLTQNIAITGLMCGNNLLTSLDLTQNTALSYLECFDNQLTSLDLTQNTALVYLACYNNQLTSIDLTQNITLSHLECGSNQLTDLDVMQNPSLFYLICSTNQLTSLDLSQNNSLMNLDCNSNHLECLNIKNGINIWFTFLDATNNPNLWCIEVDDVAWSSSNWLNLDSQTSFSTDCGNFCSLGVTELNSNTPKQLSKIIDLTGREIQYKINTMMTYIYEDGSSERVIEFE